MRQMTAMAGLVLALWCLPALAQTEVDQDEIRRLGNFVQKTGDGPQAAAGNAFLAAMSPPASDADKWFVSVITTKSCAACNQLKQAFQTDPWLRALADPSNPQQSWSHYNVYGADDRSQAWRFEKLHISEYPTVLVQPPRSGKYGDSGTVVYQGTYKGDPKQLAQEITSAIRQYIERRNQPAPAPALPKPDEPSPPWAPTPKDDVSPLPVLPDGVPVKVPPEIYPQPVVPQPMPVPVLVPQPQPMPYPAAPEAVVVTDPTEEVDEMTQKQIDEVIAALKKSRGRNLRVRQMDWPEAQNRYPLRAEELPAVIVTADGAIRDKITKKVLSLVRQKVPLLDDLPLPSPGTGFNFLAVLGLIGYVLYRLFGKRKQPPQPPSPNPGPAPAPTPTPPTPTDPKPANS